MTAWSRKLVLFLALAVMPLQGFAVALSVLLCHGDAQMHAMHVTGGSHEHGADDAGHEHGPQAAAGSHDDGSTGNASYHLCCNLTASAPPVAVTPGAAPDFRVESFVPAPLHDLFIPDRPQRPPLA
jgi:hypothetical protein